jgi:hypothetical protein
VLAMRPAAAETGERNPEDIVQYLYRWVKNQDRA